MPHSYVVLGAGVVGLSTALELHTRNPSAAITIVAKFLPGDRSIEYASPWAGANWASVATDSGRQEEWDRVTYLRFSELAGNNTARTGVQKMELRAIFDNPIEDAGVLSAKTGRIWYESLVGGTRMMGKSELPQIADFGYDFSTFVVDTQIYLPWCVGLLRDAILMSS